MRYYYSAPCDFLESTLRLSPGRDPLKLNGLKVLIFGSELLPEPDIVVHFLKTQRSGSRDRRISVSLASSGTSLCGETVFKTTKYY